MTRAEVLALADRAEKATGPDRELDADISRALGWFQKPVTMRYANPDAVVTEHYWTFEGDSRGAWSTTAPHLFTASLDAAMTLVPEGWQVEMVIRDEGAAAQLFDTIRGPSEPWIRKMSATPALALTAACLRALAEGMNDD